MDAKTVLTILPWVFWPVFVIAVILLVFRELEFTFTRTNARKGVTKVRTLRINSVGLMATLTGMSFVALLDGLLKRDYVTVAVFVGVMGVYIWEWHKAVRKPQEEPATEADETVNTDDDEPSSSR